MIKTNTQWVIGILLLLLLSLTTTADHLFAGVRICDDLGGTMLVQNRVTICNDGSDADVLLDDVLVVLNSTEVLALTNERPYFTEGVTFLYDEPLEGEVKAVDLILTGNITRRQHLLPLGAFSLNMVSGNPLMLLLENEFYLLEYPEDQELFDTELLQLTHIPTREQYTIANFAGTEWYTFDVLGGRKIAVGIFGAQVVIRSFEPGEAPAAYVVPQNLTEQFEVTFTLTTPVEITDPAIGQFTICRDDNPADVQQALVCVNDADRFTLREGELTNRTIVTRVGGIPVLPGPIPPSRSVGFLYEYVDGVKQVSVFDLKEPSAMRTNLQYNNFINSIIAGKRIALEFEDNLYLLGHPIQPTLSLPLLTLTAYQEGGTTDLSASGSEDKVEFPTLEGGKIFLQRFYGAPPPPFNLTALRSDQLMPVTLPQELFASFSSLGGVTLITPLPNVGTVSASPLDTELYQPTFMITTALGPRTLLYRTPFVEQNRNTTLYYYHSAQISGATPVKTASIYQFYNITAAPRSHPFNDQFISTFTGGNELVLGLNNSFYRLGHQGNPGEVRFYNPSQLTLRTLNGSQTFPVSVLGDVATFNTPAGRIDVVVDITAGQITFTGTTAEELAQIEFAGLMTELTPSIRVRVGTSLLRMCFLTAYSGFTSARVCDDNAILTESILVDPFTAVTINDGTNDQQYILESNQQTGNAKKVFIRRLIPLSAVQYDNPDWFAFINEIIADRKPVFNISGKLYLPYASDNRLQSFGFGAYPAGSIQPVRNLHAHTPIAYNGTVVLGNRTVFIDQQETGVETIPIEVQFSVPAYNYLPDNGDPVTLVGVEGSTLLFVSAVDGPIHTLQIVDIADSNLLRLRMDNFLDRYFAEGDSRTILLGGVPVQLTVLDLEADEDTPTITATISIRRV